MQLLQFCDKIVMVMSMISPFQGFTELQKRKLLLKLETHTYKFNKNEEILPTIKSGNIIGIIMEGSAQIVFIEYNGNEIIMENLYKDSVFGTNMSATNIENCQIIAKETTEVLVIDYNKLINPNNIKHLYYNVFLANLFNIINIKFRERNERIRILEKKQIRDKLLEFFEIEYKKNRSKYITLPFSLKDLADYIAANRSAMFREIKHLKDDKIIEVHGKKITLLYK